MESGLERRQSFDEGGDLEIESGNGVQSVKLPAGDMAVYPSGSLHRVTPMTRRARIASFFWIESFVREQGRRALLYELDQAIQRHNAWPWRPATRT